MSDVLHLNRGYGSFMRPAKYKASVLPGIGHRIGSSAAAAGDVNGDGAIDLLLGGSDGALRLVLNDSLAMRKPSDKASYHERKLLQTRIITSNPTRGLGLIGASVTLEDATGRVIAIRDLGCNSGWGSCGPVALRLAVREPNRYTLKVRFTDGATNSQTVNVGLDGPMLLPVELRDPE